jgi:L-alanine-DL-glutamate epimerase-like enolase superfamily enzyme
MARIQSVSVEELFGPDEIDLHARLAHKDGDLILHQSPGLGFRFDEKAVRRYALDKSKPWTIIR